MTCAQFDSLIPGYQEGVLNRQQYRNFYGHLTECDDCLSLFIAYHLVVLLLRDRENTTVVKMRL
jgi:hypothetical protein